MMVMDEERERLLALPAAALNSALGRNAPPFFYVQRKDGRTARHTLVTAIDRLQRRTAEHPDGGPPFAEAVAELERLMAPILAPWPGLPAASVEMTDADRRAVWTRLLAPWPAVEIAAVASDGVGTRGPIDAPGGGKAWTLEVLMSAQGMAAVCGIARSGLNLYWRPAPGLATSLLLIDDWTKPPAGTPGVRPEDTQTEEGRLAALDLLRWAQPHAFVQTSRWKTQALFVLAGGLLEHGAELAQRLNAAYGDVAVRDMRHWCRLPGVWNWKRTAELWCCRVLEFSRCRPMADSWLAQELRRLRAVQGETAEMSSVPLVQASARVRSGCTAERQASARPLPAPEDVGAGARNIEATRAVGTYLARCWGDVAGADAFLRHWNAELSQPLDDAERMRVLASIVKEDRENHPERWTGKPVPTFPAPGAQSGKSRPAKRPVSSSSSRPASSPEPTSMPARDPVLEIQLARLAAEKAGAVIRADLQTPEDCLAAVREDGRALQFLPEGLRTPDVCLAACQQNGTAMEFVPERLKTPGFCMEAVQADWRALQFVPEALKTPKLCLEAVRGGGWALKVVPDALKTPELCLEAVRKNGWALWWVPEALKTSELCLDAVQQDGLALKHVPEKLKTEALCIAAVRHDRQALDYVPERIRVGVRSAARRAVPVEDDDDDDQGGPRR